jgi:hypothetical protein
MPMPWRYVPDRYVLERSSWDNASFVWNVPWMASTERWVPIPTKDSSSAALYAWGCIIMMHARPLAVPFPVVSPGSIVKVVQGRIEKGRSIQGSKNPRNFVQGTIAIAPIFFSHGKVRNLCTNSAGQARTILFLRKLGLRGTYPTKND